MKKIIFHQIIFIAFTVLFCTSFSSCQGDEDTRTYTDPDRCYFIINHLANGHDTDIRVHCYSYITTSSGLEPITHFDQAIEPNSSAFVSIPQHTEQLRCNWMHLNDNLASGCVESTVEAHIEESGDGIPNPCTIISDNGTTCVDELFWHTVHEASDLSCEQNPCS